MRKVLWVACMLSLTLLCGCGAGPAETAVRIAPDNPQVQYFGRWDRSDPQSYRAAQGAVYIKARFTGTSIRALLDDPDDYWRVSIDGGEPRRLRPAGPVTVLAEGLVPGTHSVRLVRSTEGYMGLTRFHGFELDAGAQLAEPESRSARRLELVGDSITAGAKNDGELDAGHTNYNDIEDGDQAFGPRLARLLGADYSVVAKSGEGVVRNWDEAWPPRAVHTAERYRWTLYSDSHAGEHQLWDAREFPVDATIVAIGTNDFSLAAQRQPTRAEFIAGYKDLIRTIRAVNPGAKIICTEPVPSCIGPEPGRWVREAVAAVQAEGLADVYFIAINDPAPLLAESDYAHDSTHPVASGHAKLAAYLRDRVAAIMGWDVDLV